MITMVINMAGRENMATMFKESTSKIFGTVVLGWLAITDELFSLQLLL